MANWGDYFSQAFMESFKSAKEDSRTSYESEMKRKEKAKLDIGDLATIALFESSGVLPDGSKNAYLNQFNELSNQATQATGVPEQSGGIQPPNRQPMTVNQIQGLPRVGLNDVLMNKQFGYQTDPMVARNTAMKVAEQRALIDPKLEEKMGNVNIDEDYKQKLKKSTESEIAYSSLDPKIGYLMDVGSRAYQELKTVAEDSMGLDLDFEKGGAEYIQSALAKGGLTALKLAPLMDSATKLRPEVGLELMRQIGPFRSGELGEKFIETLPAFSGHIPTDIYNAVTSMTKSYAGLLGNQNLVTKKLSQDEQRKSVKDYEANLIRQYNKAFKQMGVSTTFHNAGINIDEIVDRTILNDSEQKIVDTAQESNPKRSKKEIIKKLILDGVL